MTAKDFAQWLRLFPTKLFVKAVTYADESGNHHKEGVVGGSEVTVVAGYIGKVESWNKFYKDWKDVLDRNSADCFHFWEWAEASAIARDVRKPTSNYVTNPYRTWSIEKLNAFWIDLAKVAASGKRHKLGGYADTKRYAEHLKKNPDPKITDARESAVWMFYENLIEGINIQFPTIQEPVPVFFDQTDDLEWKAAIRRIHDSWHKIDARIGGIAFMDKDKYLPLQVADMLGFRLHQIAMKYCGYDSRIPKSISEFDRAQFGEEYKEFSQLFPRS